MNRREAAVELLTAYRHWIGLGVVVALATGLYLGFPDVPSIPRGPRLFAVGAILAVGLGYAPAVKIVDYLHSRDSTYLVDIDARDNGLAIYELSPGKWEHLAVEKGELYRLKTSGEAYACRQYWPDYDTCLGTWRGSASDLELLRERERIDEIRETLEEQAQEGIAIRTRMGGIVRTAVRTIVNDLVGQYEQAAVHRGEHIESAVRDALDDYNAQTEEERERHEQGQQEHQADEIGAKATDGLPDSTGESAVADGGQADE